MARDHIARPRSQVDPPLHPSLTTAAMSSLDQTSAIASIDALVVERRQIRAREHPGVAISADDHSRVMAIEVELDQLWMELRRARSPMRRPTSPTTVKR